MNFKIILHSVAEFYDLKEKEILGEKRDKEIAKARHIVCFLCRNELNDSFSSIAKRFGNDHTTVIHSHRKISEEIKTKENVKEEIDQILSLIRNFNIFSEKKLNFTKKSKIGDRVIRNEIKRNYRKRVGKSLTANNLNRQIKILEKYRQGATLRCIGKEFGLTCERIRQIVVYGLTYEAIKTNISDENIDEYIRKNIEVHLFKIKEKHSLGKVKQEEKVAKKDNRWSRDYNYCRKCGTTSIRHKCYGYCLRCLPKSDIFKKIQRESWRRNKSHRKKKYDLYLKEYLKRPEVILRNKKRWDLHNFGGNREKALIRDNYRCKICGITQEKSLERWGRDLYVNRLQKGNNELDNLLTSCKSCHTKIVLKERYSRVK